MALYPLPTRVAATIASKPAKDHCVRYVSFLLSHLKKLMLSKSETYILILAVARSTIGVIERLQHLRAEDVVATRDVETSALIELCLISGHFAVVPSEAFRTNASQSLVVSVFAAGDELEAEVDVLLFFEDEASENEVSAIEAGKVAGLEDERGVVVGGQVGEIRTGGWVGG
jgi:hypothetical protein